MMERCNISLGNKTDVKYKCDFTFLISKQLFLRFYLKEQVRKESGSNTK